MQQIPKSNLLLLVTDPTCDCSIFPPVLQESTEVRYILPILQGVWDGEGGLQVSLRAQILRAEASLPPLPLGAGTTVLPDLGLQSWLGF